MKYLTFIYIAVIAYLLYNYTHKSYGNEYLFLGNILHVTYGYLGLGAIIITYDISKRKEK